MSEGHGPWGPERPPDPPPRRFRLPLRRGAVIWIGLIAMLGALIVALSIIVPGQTPGTQDSFDVLRLAGLAALVSSGLLTVRQVNVGRAARNAAAWAVILLVAVLGYAERDEAAHMFVRLRAALFPAFAVSETPRAVVVGRSEGGSFYVMGAVNGVPVRFLVDTGSTDVVLSPDDAARAHVSVSGFAHPSETANGVGYGAEATADTLTVGPFRLSSVPVAVNQAPMSASLLGMSFLKRLDSFEVRGDELILKGKS